MSLLDGIKTPLADTLSRVAAQRAADALITLGQELPCHVTAIQGQLVTVAFDVDWDYPLPDVTIPIATSVYDWLPIEVDTRGVTRAADVSIAAAAGQGTGTPKLSQKPANLSALVFAPIANATWSVPDPTQRVVQGAGGVLLQDTTGAVSINLSPSDGITLSFGGHSVVLNSMGLIIDGKAYLEHLHTGVQKGGAVSGPVAP